jgi:hypothetical protein
MPGKAERRLLTKTKQAERAGERANEWNRLTLRRRGSGSSQRYGIAHVWYTARIRPAHSGDAAKKL